MEACKGGEELEKGEGDVFFSFAKQIAIKITHLNGDHFHVHLSACFHFQFFCKYYKSFLREHGRQADWKV